MRAKRSKKYRKLMHQYELTFGFRAPYQVLLDSNFLQQVHNFKMDLIPALERTVQGNVKPLLTKCSLAAITAAQPINPKTGKPFRPYHLPPPTVLPLRHCSHNPNSEPIDEIDCLLSLLSPNAEAKKNKEHYILATADPAVKKSDNNNDSQQRKRKRDEEREEEQALRRARNLRVRARSIPGVPIIYVKRSVMVLEPLSTPSENVREGVEMDKFRVGLPEPQPKTDEAAEGAAKKKIPGLKKARGPNPLSVKKPKKRAAESGPAKTPRKNDGTGAPNENGAGDGPDGEEAGAPKTKRRRRHHKSGPREENEDGAPSTEADQAMGVDA
ncbi:rRNA processing protein [Penicillium brasilianum]|uniref:rRNA processing protein n=1 Tax=Penicillium brasilianum TaxID=104259 RepID=A0A1S9S365_PENBI|nr:rRNA processing protein [Penicillium brasilianum]